MRAARQLRILSLAAAAVSCALAADAPPPAAGDDGFRSAIARHDASATDPDHAGIWKAATPPPGTMHGEFAGNDPIGLAAGVRIAADCSINWTDPDSRKRYCFSSATSLVVFLDSPHTYLTRARDNWDRTRPGSTPTR
jgi:hypothetical protein